AAVGDLPAARRAALAFRRAVVDMTGNAVVAWTDHMVRSRLEWIIGGVGGIGKMIGDGSGLDLYEALYEALAGRDADLAEQLIRRRLGFKRVVRDRPGA